MRPDQMCGRLPFGASAAIQKVVSAITPVTKWMLTDSAWKFMAILQCGCLSLCPQSPLAAGAVGHAARVPKVTFCARGLAQAWRQQQPPVHERFARIASRGSFPSRADQRTAVDRGADHLDGGMGTSRRTTRIPRPCTGMASAYRPARLH